MPVGLQTKFGHARLRRAFWMVALIALRQRDYSFRDKFERYVARDRDNVDMRHRALTAIAAKIVRDVHALTKSETDFRRFVEMVPG